MKNFAENCKNIVVLTESIVTGLIHKKVFWDIFLSLSLTADKNNDEPDLLVLLGEAHLLVHVQVQHMLREQVHLKAKLVWKK